MNAVLAGRRNNPPDVQAGIPPLAVYNPIHYQELPELFMDFICSLTGKSPSTTGFGSEGRADQGTVQRAVARHRPEQRVRVRGPHRLRRVHDGGRLHWPALPRRSRQQHARARDLVPDARVRTRAGVPHRERLLEKVEDFEHEGRTVLGQPARLSHHAGLRRSVPGPHLRDAVGGLHRGSAQAGAAGPRRVRRRRRGDHRSAASRGGALLPRRQRRGRLPADSRAAPHHGPRPRRWAGR